MLNQEIAFIIEIFIICAYVQRLDTLFVENAIIKIIIIKNLVNVNLILFKGRNYFRDFAIVLGF